MKDIYNCLFTEPSEVVTIQAQNFNINIFCGIPKYDNTKYGGQNLKSFGIVFPYQVPFDFSFTIFCFKQSLEIYFVNFNTL